MNRWVVEKSTGRFLYGGPTDPAVQDAATQIVVTLPDERMPDPIRERYDANAPWMRRPATEQELQTDVLAVADAQADIEARRKDFLALFGTMHELFNTAWPTMTQAQRKAAIVDTRDRYAQIRRFVERNL